MKRGVWKYHRIKAGCRLTASRVSAVLTSADSSFQAGSQRSAESCKSCRYRRLRPFPSWPLTWTEKSNSRRLTEDASDRWKWTIPECHVRVINRLTESVLQGVTLRRITSHYVTKRLLRSLLPSHVNLSACSVVSLSACRTVSYRSKMTRQLINRLTYQPINWLQLSAVRGIFGLNFNRRFCFFE